MPNSEQTDFKTGAEMLPSTQMQIKKKHSWVVLTKNPCFEVTNFSIEARTALFGWQRCSNVL